MHHKDRHRLKSRIISGLICRAKVGLFDRSVQAVSIFYKLSSTLGGDSGTDGSTGESDDEAQRDVGGNGTASAAAATAGARGGGGGPPSSGAGPDPDMMEYARLAAGTLK